MQNQFSKLQLGQLDASTEWNRCSFVMLLSFRYLWTISLIHFASNRKKRKRGSVKRRLKRRPKRLKKSGNAWKKPRRKDRPWCKPKKTNKLPLVCNNDGKSVLPTIPLSFLAIFWPFFPFQEREVPRKPTVVWVTYRMPAEKWPRPRSNLRRRKGSPCPLGSNLWTSIPWTPTNCNPKPRNCGRPLSSSKLRNTISKKDKRGKTMM